MRVTKHMISNATRVEALQSASYAHEGGYRQLADFAYSEYKQTPRGLCSFTASLAHLLSIDPTFVTSISEEAAHYIDDYCSNEYVDYLKRAAEFNNLEFPAESGEVV